MVFVNSFYLSFLHSLRLSHAEKKSIIKFHFMGMIPEIESTFLKKLSFSYTTRSRGASSRLSRVGRFSRALAFRSVYYP